MNNICPKECDRMYLKSENDKKWKLKSKKVRIRVVEFLEKNKVHKPKMVPWDKQEKRTRLSWMKGKSLIWTGLLGTKSGASREVPFVEREIFS